MTPLSAQTLIAPNLRNPYYQRYSLGLQRELPFNIIMDISYVGSKGTNLYINEDYNPSVRPELRVTPAGYPTNCTPNLPVTAAQATAQFPAGSLCPLSNRFDNIQGGRTTRTNGGDSNYNAGQIEVRRRFSNNFQVTGAYTYSKLISNADEVFVAGLGSGGTSFSAFPAIFGGEREDRAVSVFDRTHRATFTYVAQSPFFKEQQGFIGRLLGGFQLSGVTIFESGVPFTIFNGFDSDGIGGANRPTFNPNGQRGVRAIPRVNSQGFITEYFNPEVITGFTPGPNPQPIFQIIDPNTAQFIVNPTFVAGLPGSVVRTGNLGRNTERSKGIRNFDMTLLKRTRVSESVFIEARIEAFNVFNHPQFGSGNNVANEVSQGLFLQPINPTTSGTISPTSNSGGRSIRYQAKFIF